MSSEKTINSFCSLVKTKYANLTLKELCQEASRVGIIVNMPTLESWLKARGIRVRKKHSYYLRAVERICQYSEQNPNKTHNDLQRLCEQIFGHKVEQSVIATWLSRRQINLRKTRASKKPGPTSALTANDERLLHYAPGFKRVRNCAGGDPKTVLLMLQFVHNSLMNKTIVSDNDVRLYLENVHGIVKRTEQITTLFRRYTLTHRLREVKLKRCSPEEFVRYIRDSFPEIPEFGASHCIKTDDRDEPYSSMTLELMIEENGDSDHSQPTTPDQIENPNTVVLTPGSSLTEINGYPASGGNEMFQSYQCQQPNITQPTTNIEGKHGLNYFPGHERSLPQPQAGNISTNPPSSTNHTSESQPMMQGQVMNYMYSLPFQNMEYYQPQYQYSGYYEHV